MNNITCRYGEFYVPNHKDIIYDSLRDYGEWAQLEIEIIKKFIKPSNRVVDAGAFIGTFSRAISNHIGKDGAVFAFEPNPELFGLLCRNIEIANYNNITPYNLGLGSAAYFAYVSGDDNQYNLGATQIIKEKTSKQLASTEIKTLDDFHLENIDFIKADIEGMEFEMLQGASITIAQNRSVIFLEVNNLEKGFPLLNWANTNDYTTFGTISDAYNTDNFNKNKDNWLQDGRECGLIFIHNKSLSKFDDTIIQTQLRKIYNADDLASLLMLKPQYRKYISILCKENKPYNKIQENQGLNTNKIVSKTYETKIFWRSHWTEQYDGYSEERSTSILYPVNGQSQLIELHLLEVIEEITRIRLDILNTIGIIDVELMQLLSPTQTTIWQWDGDLSIFKRQVQVALIQNAINRATFTAISFGSDPWFELDLTPEIYSQIKSGCTLSLQIRPYNLLTQLPTIIKKLINHSDDQCIHIPRTIKINKTTTSPNFSDKLSELTDMIKQSQARHSKMTNQKRQLNQELLRANAQIELLKNTLKL